MFRIFFLICFICVGTPLLAGEMTGEMTFEEGLFSLDGSVVTVDGPDTYYKVLNGVVYTTNEASNWQVISGGLVIGDHYKLPWYMSLVIENNVGEDQREALEENVRNAYRFYEFNTRRGKDRSQPQSTRTILESLLSDSGVETRIVNEIMYAEIIFGRTWTSATLSPFFHVICERWGDCFKMCRDYDDYQPGLTLNYFPEAPYTEERADRLLNFLKVKRSGPPSDYVSRAEMSELYDLRESLQIPMGSLRERVSECEWL